jgi:hypothetical protein
LNSVRVSAGAIASTPSTPATALASLSGKLEYPLATKLSCVNRDPGLMLRIFRMSSCAGAFSRCRAAASSPVTANGRVTDMSVPTPVSGASTSACASPSPFDSAITVATMPTPAASPREVSTVRPLASPELSD